MSGLAGVLLGEEGVDGSEFRVAGLGAGELVRDGAEIARLLGRQGLQGSSLACT